MTSVQLSCTIYSIVITTSNQKPRIAFFIALLPIILIGLIFIPLPKAFAAQLTVNLGTAADFAILAGTPLISDSPTSAITGNVGLSPATGADIGLTVAQVTGTIYAVDAFGPVGSINNPGLLTIAKNDLTTAYDDAAGRTPVNIINTELGGQTLVPGVYASGETTFGITAGAGPLILDGQGDSNAVFIFEVASDDPGLTVGPGSVVSLTNGACASNVFWRVTSAAINTTAVFKGNILALNSITVANGANIEGRLLARDGQVTLINDTIKVPTCVTPTPTPTPNSTTSTSTSTSNAAPEIVCLPLDSTVITPIIIESKRINANSIFLSWGPYSGVDTFNVRYGPTNGNWLYNTDVTGFSTTINALPSNQPIWFQVAARNNCLIGTYGESKLTEGGGGAGSQVLGASTDTLATTGSNDQFLMIIIAATAALFFFLLGKALLQGNETS